MPAAPVIHPHFEPGQHVNNLTGYHDVRLISEQYPNGITLTKGQCIKVYDVGAPVGIGMNRNVQDVEGKIEKFLDTVVVGAERPVYGLKLENGEELVFADSDDIYSHHYETMFDNIKVVPCPNGGKRKRRLTKRKRTNKRKTQHKRRKY
jgi:hypothetical protein